MTILSLPAWMEILVNVIGLCRFPRHRDLAQIIRRTQQARRNWTDRRGVVKRIIANKANVMMRWDGRRIDLSIRSIEPEAANLG